MDITALKKITLTEQIMEQIAGQITSGKMKPGEKLPNERAMGEMFHVTRSRVREALRALSLIGLIDIKPGDGSYVCEQRPALPEETITWIFHKEIHNLDEVYAARKLIEAEVYLTAIDHVTTEQRLRLDGIMADLTSAAEHSEGAVRYHQLLDDYDLLMGQFCGNQIYNKLMQTIVLLRKEFSRKLLQSAGAIEHSIKMRKKIHDAFAHNDKPRLKKSLNAFYTSSRHFYDTILAKEQS